MPALTGHSPNYLEQLLFSLPSKLGVLGINNPITLSAVKFPASFHIRKPLKTLILAKNVIYSEEVRCSHFSNKLEIKQSKAVHSSSVSTDLCIDITTLYHFKFVEGCHSSFCERSFKLAKRTAIARVWICFT